MKDKIMEAINEILQEDRLVSGKELSVKLGVSETTINYHLQKMGLRQYDIFSQVAKGHITLFNDITTSQASYWLGYLQADGCVNCYKENRLRLILECGIKDKEILYNFCKDASINPLRIKTRDREGLVSARLELGSQSFSTFPPLSINKTYKDESLPQGINFYAYLKGLMDGDGGIYHGERGNQFKLLCRNPMCSEIVERLKQDLPNPTSIWIQNHPTTEGLYIIIIGSGRTPSQKETNNLYYLYNQFYILNQTCCLTRKKNTFEEILTLH